MEKISRILPSTRRFQNVDHSNAQPVRPGAPAFGRPEGRVTRSALVGLDELMPKRGSQVVAEAIEPDVVVDISDKVLAEESASVETFKNNDKTIDKFKIEDSKNYQAPAKNVETQKVEEMTKKFFRLDDKKAPVDEVTKPTPELVSESI